MKLSNKWLLSLRDIGKSIIVAIITAVVTTAYELFQNGTLFEASSLKTIGMVSMGAMLSYLIKNVLTTSDGKFLGKEKKTN